MTLYRQYRIVEKDDDTRIWGHYSNMPVKLPRPYNTTFAVYVSDYEAYSAALADLQRLRKKFPEKVMMLQMREISEWADTQM
jgi:hypothetical protein